MLWYVPTQPWSLHVSVHPLHQHGYSSPHCHCSPSLSHHSSWKYTNNINIESGKYKVNKACKTNIQKNFLKTVHCRNQQDFTTSKPKRWMYIIWFPIIQIQVCSIFHSNWFNTSVQSSSVKLVSLSLQFNISVTLSGSCSEHENPNWHSF